jgi:alkaline phosphatase D
MLAFRPACPSSSRRLVLRRAWQLALSAWTGSAALAAGCTSMGGRFDADPFTLGVASGAPQPDGFVIWTRLAPDPRRADGGLDPEPVAVHWEVAVDESFKTIVRRGQATALPSRAHSVHVEVDGLSPGRDYHYRFFCGGGANQAASPSGRSRTAPAADVMPGRLRFAFASCQQYEQGYYGAYRHMLAEEPDLVVFLGDYIYESSWGDELVRRHWTGEPHTLDQYRVRHAQYRSDPDLKRMHAAAPWLITWDDHEVDNDYADDRAEDLAAGFVERRAAAYRAWFEHMPLRACTRPFDTCSRIHDRHRFGRLAEFFMLDDRQYREHQACPRPGRGGSSVIDIAGCPQRLDPSRSMLGREQEAWLDRSFAESGGRWNLVAQQTLFSRAIVNRGDRQMAWTDGWDGYPAARQRLIDSMRASRLSNPLVIGGDIHSFVVSDVKADFDDPVSPVVATEFCGTSITSRGRSQHSLDQMKESNPHIRLADSRHRGYTLVELSPQRCEVALRTLDSIKIREPKLSTLARFGVEPGRPGAIA